MAATRKKVPARYITASDFKATCLELMNEVQTRHIEVIVTKRGKPVAKLAPVEIDSPSPVGFMRGTVIMQGDLVSPDPAAWESSPADPLQ